MVEASSVEAGDAMKTLGPTWLAALALIETLVAHAKICTDGPACTRAPFLVKRFDAYTRAHFNPGRRKRVVRFMVERMLENAPEHIPDDVRAAVKRNLDTMRDSDN